MTRQSTARPDSDPATDCCSVPAVLDDEGLAADVQLLSALGNDTRYEALRIVAGAEDGVCVCQLQPALGVSQGAVSQALSRLHSAGLVTRRKEGRWRYYSATEPAAKLLAALDEIRGGAGE